MLFPLSKSFLTSLHLPTPQYKPHICNSTLLQIHFFISRSTEAQEIHDKAVCILEIKVRFIHTHLNLRLNKVEKKYCQCENYKNCNSESMTKNLKETKLILCIKKAGGKNHILLRIKKLF